jgi:methyl-accepting chemotaxis protein
MLTHTRIVSRLAIMLAVNIALMAALGAIGFIGMAQIREGLRTVYEDRTIALGQIHVVLRQSYEIRLAALTGIDDPTVVAEKKAAIAELRSKLDATWKAYLATYLTPDEANIAKSADGEIAAYQAIVDDEFGKLAAGDLAAARELAKTKGAPAFDAMSKDIEALAQLQSRVAGEEYQKASDVYTRDLYLLIAIVAAAIALGAVLAWIIARSITRPLNGIIGVMGELTKGNLKVEVGGQDRRDEVGSVAKAVGIFKDGLTETERMRAEQQQAQARQIERGQKMDAAVSTFDKAIGEVVGAVSAAATELQATAKSLSATAEETAHQSNAVAAAAEEMSQNVQTVAAATEELSTSIAEISNQVSESTRIVGTAVTQADDTNARVGSLSEAAQRIGDVVRLINDIAGQTNLLALNATIEAARAGEAGKGFAVVASEVKTLATQTARATEEIAGQVRAIQEATNTSATAISAITETIGRVNEISTAIAAAVEEQGAATREISRNVQQAASGTAEVTTNIVGVTQSSQQTSAGSAQVLSAAGELAQNGERLKREVDTFLHTVRAL